MSSKINITGQAYAVTHSCDEVKSKFSDIRSKLVVFQLPENNTDHEITLYVLQVLGAITYLQNRIKILESIFDIASDPNNPKIKHCPLFIKQINNNIEHLRTLNSISKVKDAIEKLSEARRRDNP